MNYKKILLTFSLTFAGTVFADDIDGRYYYDIDSGKGVFDIKIEDNEITLLSDCQLVDPSGNIKWYWLGK